MIDINEFVNENYRKLNEIGLSVDTNKSEAVKSMQMYPQEMLDDLGEEEIITFLFPCLSFSNAFTLELEGLSYSEFLCRVQKISNGELYFESINEDMSEEVVTSGQGECIVSFKYNGNDYKYTAKVMYDWMDRGFISYLNKIFEGSGNEKRLVFFGDPNGYLLAYLDPEFCKKAKAFYPVLDADIA